jgi:hypothetical protein
MINYAYHGIEIVRPVELLRPVTVAKLTVIHSETPIIALICATDLNEALIPSHGSWPTGVNEFDTSDPGYF